MLLVNLVCRTIMYKLTDKLRAGPGGYSTRFVKLMCFPVMNCCYLHRNTGNLPFLVAYNSSHLFLVLSR